MELVEQKPVIPPLQRHLQLETDFFCHQCGYNLHGQIVTRDERLDLLVCRCPECGRFHPAALGVTATRPWLARLGILLLVWWVMTVIAVVLAGGFFQGLFTYFHMEAYTEHMGQADGWRQNFYSTERIPRRPSEEDQYHNAYWKWFVGLSALDSVLLGMFCSVAMWHVRKSRLPLVVLWPILPALITYWLWWGNEDIRRIVGWSIARIAGYALFNMACVAIGLWIGRPVARFVLRVIVPPKLRQHVHFLWTCDGKTPPKISDAQGALA